MAFLKPDMISDLILLGKHSAAYNFARIMINV